MSDGKLELALETLRQCRGVRGVKLLAAEEKRRLLRIEAEVEKRIILGMCPSVNLGVREALARPFTAGMVIDTPDFPHPHHPHMRILLGDVVVGEQLLDRDRISELRRSQGSIFLWDNFVVYRNRLPRDAEGRSRLRLVYLPRRFPALDGLPGLRDEVLGVPSPQGDEFMKGLLGETSTEPTVGTSLVGFTIA